jgi:hypothetical protein
MCYRMTVAAFRREMDDRRRFFKLVTRYTHALVGFIMQSTACNTIQKVEQRLARWLLTAQDRMGSDAFPLTQEFAGMMLGTTRPTVRRRGGVAAEGRSHQLSPGPCHCAGSGRARGRVMRVLSRHEGLMENVTSPLGAGRGSRATVTSRLRPEQ